MKKGVMDLTQSSVIYIVIFLLFVVVGIALLTGANVFAYFGLDKLNKAFDPGRVSFSSSPYVSAACDNTGKITTMTLQDVELAINDPGKDEGDSINFFLIATLGTDMSVGQYAGSGGDANLITCKKSDSFACSVKGSLVFNFMNPAKTGQQLHITVWRASPKVREFVTKIKAGEVTPNTYYQLLDQAPADFGGTLTNFKSIIKAENCGIGVMTCTICTEDDRTWCTEDVLSPVNGYCSPAGPCSTSFSITKNAAQKCATGDTSYVNKEPWSINGGGIGEFTMMNQDGTARMQISKATEVDAYVSLEIYGQSLVNGDWVDMDCGGWFNNLGNLVYDKLNKRFVSSVSCDANDQAGSDIRVNAISADLVTRNLVISLIYS